MTITSRDVKSSTVASIAHDDATRVLTVRFRTPSGEPAPDEYRHAGVPRSVFDQLAGEALRVQSGYPGASVGKMFHQLVRGKYQTTRVATGESRPTNLPPSPAFTTTMALQRSLMLSIAEFAFKRGLVYAPWETVKREIIAHMDGAPLAVEPPRPAASAGADPFALSTDALRGV